MTDTLAAWYQGARPHTWANAFAPVIAGSGAAAAAGGFDLGRALLAAIVSWALIVGVNYANDYSDGIRGTDDERSGPLRLVGSGTATPSAVKLAAFAAFGVAGAAGILLSLLAGAPWLIAVGVVCVLAAWFYTGGDNPYGYRGFGELAVFVFFGLVAVLGTQYTQAHTITGAGVLCAVAVGCFSSGVNLANNIRDIPSDREAGKITLAVTLGDGRARTLWMLLAALPFVLTTAFGPAHPAALLAVAALPLAAAAGLPIYRGAQGPALIPVLGLLGRAMLVWTILTAVGLAL
ncbi:1,4-dihydroxy-2-naphthoate polyprenyltransferase [Corynebacterium sp. 13CS0277]|uniref:1,4-dihydroxy-2-naphthoate polyprenyltransferase n=1 Tax=Corynebacterium sp. 13CS0277 TaxID=2071994 RepID=UPI000D034DE4|nr:1,4-dihydroxy-2-naphthoate polyprenyltransferase [Corynebacterium sp. 13CS0277]PRQ10663.1 1,4-dihydroxy-2-naphthoate polyprenyltransferase [Corynebacterium sp. 13CS0277]